MQTIASKKAKPVRSKDGIPSKKTHKLDWWKGNFHTGQEFEMFFREIKTEENEFDFDF